jgi:hypothetical protein
MQRGSKKPWPKVVPDLTQKTQPHLGLCLFLDAGEALGYFGANGATTIPVLRQFNDVS